ncbi:nuclear pore complex subunit, variant 2 [Entomophthora muscae]|uniref:Nuclear pore complex subunit, variant 2 n=1 Tax=Entomophthora muscae TaxID=34485 RepID=A0ACC2T5V9_9FUNG|nr:nuclear pore complex subunit, variant 2 [Entomophthora muscae]
MENSKRNKRRMDSQGEGASALPPASAPVQEPVQALFQAPFQSPFQAPVQAPVQTPAQAPVETPAQASAKESTSFEPNSSRPKRRNPLAEHLERFLAWNHGKPVTPRPEPELNGVPPKTNSKRSLFEDLAPPKPTLETETSHVRIDPTKDQTELNFEKLSKHPIGEPEEPPVKRARSSLLELLESAAKPLLGLSNLFTSKPAEVVPIIEVRKPTTDLSILRFMKAYPSMDLFSLSLDSIRRHTGLFTNSIEFARRKLLERPLAALFPVDKITPEQVKELPNDDIVAGIVKEREESYLAYHPVIATLADSRNHLNYLDEVIHKSLASRLEAASQKVNRYETTGLWQILGFLGGESLAPNSEGYYADSLVGQLRKGVEQKGVNYTLFGHDCREPFYLHRRQKLIKGSIHCLQSRFFHHMKFTLLDDVTGPSPTAYLTGMTTLEGIMGRYAALQFYKAQRPDLATSTSALTWAILFLLFRCGFYDRMLKYAFEWQDHLDVEMYETVDWGVAVPFYVLLGIFVEGERFMLPSCYRLKLLDDYLEYLENGNNNPFRLAFYHLLIRDFDQQPAMPSPYIQSAEDLLWWNLTQYQDFSTDGPTIQAIQEQVRSLNPGDAPLREVAQYTQLLLLTHQFEEAVGVLASKPILECEALHLACALMHYRLLRVPKVPNTITVDLVFQEEGEPCFNIIQFFAKTLPWYTAMDVFHFMDYYSYLTLLPRPEYNLYARELIYNLILGTNQCAVLLRPTAILERYRSAFDRPHSNLYGMTPAPERYRVGWGKFNEIMIRAAGAQSIDNLDFVVGLELFFAVEDVDAGIKEIQRLLATELSDLFRDWSKNLKRLVFKTHIEHYKGKLPRIHSLRDGLIIARNRGIMDTRKQPSHIVELASTRLLYFVQLAECILDQNGATLYEVASKIDVIPTSRYFKDNKIWRQQFQDLPLHLKELLPLTLIVLSNVMQYLYPGLHARLDPIVGGIRMVSLSFDKC